MNAKSTPLEPTVAEDELQTRAQRTEQRIANIGIPKQELAQKAGIDRGTLGRLLKADTRITDRTWVKVERVLSQLEEEYGIAAGGPGSQFAAEQSASSETVTSTVEYAGAKITLSGRADAVAEAIRRVLDEG